jgi:hypothetical protein
MQPAPQSPRPPIGERARNFLLYGFLISIALHLAVGPFVKFTRTPETQEKVETVRVDKMPTPPPTPKPTPKPTPTPPPTPPPKTPPPATPVPKPPQQIKINTIQQNSKTTGGTTEQSNTHVEGNTQGVPIGVPSGVPSAPPATPVPATPAPPPPPTPTPPACPRPNVPPRVVAAVQPETPPIAQQQGITGEVEVVVTLDANNQQSAEPKILKSASKLLEQAALRSAKASKFETEIKNCVHQASAYRFVVEFQSQ